MDFKEILTALLSKAYKMDEEQINDLLTKTDGGELTAEILNHDRTRIAELGTKKYQEAMKKAKAELLGGFEKEVREKYGITDETLQGMSLIEGLVATQVSEATKDKGKGPKAADLTDDDIKRHSAYQALENRLKADVAAKEAEWTEKYNKRETEYKQAETKATVHSKVLNILDGLPIAWPKTPEKAAAQKQLFLRQLDDFSYAPGEGANPFVVSDPSGTVLEDGHGNTLSFNDFVKGRAESLFDFTATNGGSNGGTQKPNTTQSGNKTLPTPKNLEELTVAMNNKDLSQADKAKIMEVFEAGLPK